MKLKAVLFDLDGVLIDTEGTYTTFWNEMDRLHPTGVENFAQTIKGSTLTKILSTYFPDPEAQADVSRRLNQLETGMKYRVFPGVFELLEGLRAKGIKTAIVTSSNRIKMGHLFGEEPRLDELTDALVTDEDVTASKPDPQPYIIGATKLGLDPEECIVVEDSVSGLESGRRAGAFVLGVATTNPRAVVEPLADMTVDALADVSADCLVDKFENNTKS